jgi:hypothetical protein
MRGRFARLGDRAIGIAIILLFLFLGSRETIDEPSLSGGATQTVTQPATTTKPPR